MVFPRFLLCLTLFPLTGLCQKEAWDTYLAHYDKGVGSTSVNMALKEVAPMNDLPFVLVAGVRFRECNSQGLPTEREFLRLSIISDSLQVHVDSLTRRNLLAGTFTYLCGHADYYYVTDTSRLRQQLSAFIVRQFPGYTPYIVIKEDPGWQDYLKFLYPSPAIQEYMANQKSVLKLREAGDSLVKPRKVIHWLLFKNKADYECFGRYAVSKKFRIERVETTKEAAHPYRLLISRTDKVDLESINALTTLLKKQAEPCHGEYGGWETEVSSQ